MTTLHNLHPQTKMTQPIKQIMNKKLRKILAPKVKASLLLLNMASSRGLSESENSNVKSVTMYSIQQRIGTNTIRRIIPYFCVWTAERCFATQPACTTTGMCIPKLQVYFPVKSVIVSFHLSANWNCTCLCTRR